MESAADRRRERELMVQQQIEARGVDLPAVLDAMRSVPRERFLPEELDEFAYHDAALPIAEGQTISQPFVVALMASALDPKPEHRVLEIGTGSGYGAAVLSRIVREVYTVERHASLAAAARQQLDELGYRNVVVRHGDGTLGDPEHAPFDGIVVTAAGREVPKPLLEQLAIGGRMVIPVGEEGSVQRLRRITRTAQDDYTDEDLGEVRFVPLVSGSAAATASAGTEPHAEQAAGSHATANESRPRFPWFRRAADGEDLPARVREAAEPLRGIDDANLGRLLNRLRNARLLSDAAADHARAGRAPSVYLRRRRGGLARCLADRRLCPRSAGPS